MLRHLAVLAAAAFVALPCDALAAKLRSLQRNTLSFPSGQTTQTVTLPTPVNRDRSLLLFEHSGDTTRPERGSLRGSLTADNTITFTRGNTGIALTVTWTVLEFTSGVNVQRGTDTVNSSTNVTLPRAVDPARSFVLVSAQAPSGDQNFGGNDFVRAHLTNGTTLSLNHHTSDNRTVEWQVVEWDAATVQRDQGTLSNGNNSSGNISLGTPAPLNKSIALVSWKSRADGNGENWIRARLTDANTLVVDRARTGTTIDYAWQVVTFEDETTVQQGSVSIGTLVTDTSRTIALGTTQNNRSAALLSVQWLMGRPAVYGLLAAVPAVGLGETRYRPPALAREMARASV
ncbi:MAG: hypothetical protein ACK4N5_24695, partial [Myxococcales bacterium]